MKQRINHQYYYQIFVCLLLYSFSACQSAGGEGDKRAGAKPPPMTIHQAAFMADAKAVKQHIEAGTNLNEKDEYGSTPLIIAATFNKKQVAKLLIEAGAELAVRSNDGSTALHTAAFLGRTEIVKALLAADADLEAKNNYGSTALASIEGPFDEVKPIYDQLSKDLGPLGFKLNYSELEAARKEIAKLLRDHQ